MNLVALKSRMAEINMTPAKLTRESGVSESTIKRIMRGKTDVHTSTLRMIAAAVGMDPSALIDDTADTPLAFDPANAPEISAEVLEEMTEIAQIEEMTGQMTGNLAENDMENDQSNENRSNEYDRSFGDISPECENFYERMITYLKQRLEASYTANEQIRLQNTELVKANSRLLEQEAVTRARNRALYTGIIIACCVAGLCLAGLVAYFVYDMVSPTWGMVRY